MPTLVHMPVPSSHPTRWGCLFPCYKLPVNRPTWSADAAVIVRTPEAMLATCRRRRDTHSANRDSVSNKRVAAVAPPGGLEWGWGEGGMLLSQAAQLTCRAVARATPVVKEFIMVSTMWDD